MANLEQFTLQDSWNEWTVTVEIDRDLLTEEAATEINEFWSGSDDRLCEAGDDVVRAVVKMAAQRWVYQLLEVGGGMVRPGVQATTWTTQLHEMEGWGGIVKGAAFGACGIRLVEADVTVDLDLEFKGV